MHRYLSPPLQTFRSSLVHSEGRIVAPPASEHVAMQNRDSAGIQRQTGMHHIGLDAGKATRCPRASCKYRDGVGMNVRWCREMGGCHFTLNDNTQGTCLCFDDGPGIDTPFPQVRLVGDYNPREGCRCGWQGRSHSLQPPPTAFKRISVAHIEYQTYKRCVLVVCRSLFAATDHKKQSKQQCGVINSGFSITCIWQRPAVPQVFRCVHSAVRNSQVDQPSYLL